MKQNNYEICDLKDFLDHALETYPMPVFFKDRQGIYQGCNELFAQFILGLEKGDIIGKGISDLNKAIPEDLAKRYIEQDERLFQDGGLQIYESLVKCADGDRHPFRFVKTVLTTDGEIRGLLGYMVDQDGYVPSTRQFSADQATLELGKKAATIVHEILNPLTVVQGMLTKVKKELKKTDMSSPEDVDRLLTSLDKGLSSIDMIKEITDWVRGMSYKSSAASLEMSNDIHKEVYDINEIIQGASDMMDFQVLKSGVELNYPNKKFAKTLKIYASKTQVIQLLVNLIKNANDAISELDEKWIRIHLERDEQFLNLRIIDSGVIGDDQLSKVFDDGYTTKLRGQGSGIGLGLCKKIAQSHDGELMVEKYEGHTSFLLRVPLIQ